MIGVNVEQDIDFGRGCDDRQPAMDTDDRRDADNVGDGTVDDFADVDAVVVGLRCGIGQFGFDQDVEIQVAVADCQADRAEAGGRLDIAGVDAAGDRQGAALFEVKPIGERHGLVFTGYRIFFRAARGEVEAEGEVESESRLEVNGRRDRDIERIEVGAEVERQLVLEHTLQIQVERHCRRVAVAPEIQGIDIDAGELRDQLGQGREGCETDRPVGLEEKLGQLVESFAEVDKVAEILGHERDAIREVELAGQAAQRVTDLLHHPCEVRNRQVLEIENPVHVRRRDGGFGAAQDIQVREINERLGQ